MDKEIVHLEIEGELRFLSEYDFVGASESPVQGGVGELDFHLQDLFSVLTGMLIMELSKWQSIGIVIGRNVSETMAGRARMR